MTERYARRVAKLVGLTLVLAGSAYAAWWYWQASKEASAEAWAAGTDRVY